MNPETRSEELGISLRMYKQCYGVGRNMMMANDNDHTPPYDDTADNAPYRQAWYDGAASVGTLETAGV